MKRKKFKVSMKSKYYPRPNFITLKKCLKDTSHWVSVNMNDTFHYACADVSDINSDDFVQLFPLYKKHGFDIFIAYESIKRGYNPDIPQNNGPELEKLKKLLLDKMEKDDEYLFDLNYEVRKWKKEIEKYGSRLKYKSIKTEVQLSFFDKIKIRSFKPKFESQLRCFPEKTPEIYGIGSCIYDAIQDLNKKLNIQ